VCLCANARSLPHSNVGTYATVWGNFVICPPPGQRVPIFAYNFAYKGDDLDFSYDVQPGNCTDQIKSSIFTDPRPASCEPPAPTWPCSAAACWIDTGDKAAVLAAYRAYHGGTTFGASHGDWSYGARTIERPDCGRVWGAVHLAIWAPGGGRLNAPLVGAWQAISSIRYDTVGMLL
jgi:hypothetical protein